MDIKKLLTRFKMWLYFKTHPYDKTVYESHKAAFGGNSAGKQLIAFGPASSDDRYRIQVSNEKAKQGYTIKVRMDEPPTDVLKDLEPADATNNNRVVVDFDKVMDHKQGYISYESIESMESAPSHKEVEDAVFSKYTEGVTEPIKKPRRKATVKQTTVEAAVN